MVETLPSKLTVSGCL